MTTSPSADSSTAARHPPLLEIALIIGLPLAVLLAGAYTTSLAYRQGFTPTPVAVSVPGH